MPAPSFVPASSQTTASSSTESPPTKAPSKCHCHCDKAKCRTAIQAEYDDLLHCLKTADAALPRHKPGVEKSWWTPQLTELKEKSIAIHQLWVVEGKPHQGPTNVERLRVKADYKRALKSAQRAPKQASWNRLHDAMASNDTNTFWRSWKTLYSKNDSDLPPVVDGLTSKEAIAESFRQTFEKNSQPNNHQKVKEVDEKFSTEYEKLSSAHGENCTCQNFQISLEDVFDSVLNLKNGKSEDDDGICAEHFLNAPYIVFQKLHTLFNDMIRHSFVPNQFRFGSIIPIVKDRHGNHGDVNNYRGITISPIASKIFEHALKIVYGHFFSSSPWQFGFKSRSSTLHALYCLKESVNYYVNHGSRVFCAFLDASKAFDRLIHSGLFLKLIERGIPKIFLDLMIYWYSDLWCRVRWGECYSQWFPVLAGVRQGGILSPDFYCLYVDDLVSELESLNVGCYVLDVFMASLLYADDMALLAPSIKGLQSLLDKCSEFCVRWDICLNAKKSKLLYFGKRCGGLFSPSLDGKQLEWVDSWDYLGVNLVSGKEFGCSAVERIKKFYRCANAIFRIEGRSDDLTMLHLVQSHCVPVLTYGIEISHLSDVRERSKIRAAYNSLFRRIFGYRVFESVTDLQLSLACPTWELLTEDLKVGFYDRLSRCTAASPVHIFSVT